MKITIDLNEEVIKLIAEHQIRHEQIGDAIRDYIEKINPMDIMEMKPIISPIVKNIERSGWSYKGVKLPNGTKIKIEYVEIYAEGIIKNNTLYCAGIEAMSPSGLVDKLIRQKRNSNKVSLNGWLYLYFQDENNQWIQFNEYRNHLIAQNKQQARLGATQRNEL